MKKEKVDERFTKILAPIEARKQDLMKKKETFQFKRDIEDENLWTDEKMAIASSQEVGNSLQAANFLLKKNKMMQAEIANHEPRVNAVFENSQELISEGHPGADKHERDLNNLTEKWARPLDLLEARRQKLLKNEKIQQFLLDANEAESWMSEQELYMMVEDRGKDEFSAQNLMKKHDSLETSLEDYAETVRQLGETNVEIKIKTRATVENEKNSSSGTPTIRSVCMIVRGPRGAPGQPWTLIEGAW